MHQRLVECARCRARCTRTRQTTTTWADLAPVAPSLSCPGLSVQRGSPELHTSLRFMYRRHSLSASPLPRLSKPQSINLSPPRLPCPRQSLFGPIRSFHASLRPLSRRAPWEILGVPPNADEATIKKAWRQKAKQYHPDLNMQEKRAHDRFVEAKLAYEAMLSPEKKMQWNMEQQAEAFSHRERARNAKRSTPNQPPPDAGEEEMRQFWRDFEKIFQDMDQSKRGSRGYQRIKVEFKRPFRGSEFGWAFEEEKKKNSSAGNKGNTTKSKSNEQGTRSQRKKTKTMNDFFSSVFESFFSDSMPRAEWKEFDFLPSSFLLQEDTNTGHFEVLGDAISFGSVRFHPQDHTLLEYTVNGKIVARGVIGTRQAEGISEEVLSIYNWRGSLIGTVSGPLTNRWLHSTKTYEVVDGVGRPMFAIEQSLVLFNKLTWRDAQSRPVAAATRSRLAARAPFQFTFAYQPDDVHPAFFVMPLVAFRTDNLHTGPGLLATLKADFTKLMDWLEGKR